MNINISFFEKYNNLLTKVAFFNIFVLWGSTFIAVAYALKGFPPFILTGLRFLIAGSILMTIMLYKKEYPNSLNNWLKNLVPATFILTGGTGLVAWSEQYVSSTEAAIAIATSPFWVLIFDKKNWSYYYTNKVIILGLIVGFIGLILFLNGSFGSVHNSTENFSDGSERIIAFVVLGISSIFWVVGSLYSKNKPSSQSTLMNISQQLLLAGVINLSIASISSEWATWDINNIPIISYLGLIFLIFFGSLLTYFSYIWLLSFKSAATVSIHTYINPIVAVFLGIFISNEIITQNQVFGLIIILTGVLLTNFNNYKTIINKTIYINYKKIVRYKFYRYSKFNIRRFYLNYLGQLLVIKYLKRLFYPSRYHI